MSSTRLEELKSLISKLQADRQGHLGAIAEIDEAFATLGIQPEVKKKRGRKSGVAKKTRTRGKFKTTATESILTFVKAAGSKGTTGAKIVQDWKAEGRKAGCYNALGKLIKEKKIKRQKLKGQKGSLYVAG
jgi:hypothetical protein